MKFKFKYNTQTYSLNISNIDNTQAANLFLDKHTLWRYLKEDWNTPQEPKRRIFRLNLTLGSYPKLQGFQYEDELGQALYVFAKEFFKLKNNIQGEYTGTIDLVQNYGIIVSFPPEKIMGVFLKQENRGGMKLNAIKEIREILPLSLKDAKDLIDLADTQDVYIKNFPLEIPKTNFLTFIMKEVLCDESSPNG